MAILSASTHIPEASIRLQCRVAEYLGDRLLHIDQFTSAEVVSTQTMPAGARRVEGVEGGSNGASVDGVAVLVVSQSDANTGGLPAAVRVEAGRVADAFGAEVWAHVTPGRPAVLAQLEAGLSGEAGGS